MDWQGLMANKTSNFYCADCKENYDTKEGLDWHLKSAWHQNIVDPNPTFAGD